MSENMKVAIIDLFSVRWFYLDCPQYYVVEGDGSTNQQVTLKVYRRGDLSGTQMISK